MPKAVIFDVDGTLIDSADLHAKAWQDAFRAPSTCWTEVAVGRDQDGVLMVTPQR